MIRYLGISYIAETIVPLIEANFVLKNDPIPNYLDDKKGMDKLESALQSVRERYYPRFFDKAAFLLVNINLGHFFENGNKRLSLATLLAFIFENGYEFRNFKKDSYKNKLLGLFPRFNKFKDQQTFLSYEFAFYNLCIIIADYKNYDLEFKEVKEKVKEFIKFSIYKSPASK